MAACFGGLLNPNRHTRRTFFQRCTRAIPRERPAPVHADFIVRIDDVFNSKLVTKNHEIILRDRDREVFSLVSPIGIANPDDVLARTWNLEILIKFCARFVGGCGG